MFITSTLKMVVSNSSDRLVATDQTTRRHNPEQHSLNVHRCD